jgi:hypothetical protein
MSELHDELASHLILQYRKLIEERYQYASLAELLHIPSQISEEDVDKVREFFLKSVYPPPEQREELDSAFKNLKSYILNPAKAIGLLGNVAIVSFSFGTKLPQAIKAGMVSLESYLSARKFEERLLEVAEEKYGKVPLSQEEFLDCINQLPYEESVKFIEEIGSFMVSLTNIELLEKTVEILNRVVDRMSKRPRLFKPGEVAGIKLGVNILQHGYEVFSSYDTATRGQIVRLIMATEKYYLELHNSLDQGR